MRQFLPDMPPSIAEKSKQCKENAYWLWWWENRGIPESTKTRWYLSRAKVRACFSSMTNNWLWNESEWNDEELKWLFHSIEQFDKQLKEKRRELGVVYDRIGVEIVK